LLGRLAPRFDGLSLRRVTVATHYGEPAFAAVSADRASYLRRRSVSIEPVRRLSAVSVIDPMRRTLLLVADGDRVDPAVAQAAADTGLEVAPVAEPSEALDRTGRDEPCVILIDLGRLESHGLEQVGELARRGHPAAVVVAVAPDALKHATDALRRGASDLVIQPLDPVPLRLALARALRTSELQAELRALRRRLEQMHGQPALLTRNPRMRRIGQAMKQAALSGEPILLEGEPGAGKEWIARRIHEASGGPGRFVAVHCAGLPDRLLEVELFGREAGADDPDGIRRWGGLERAHAGMLYLDEVDRLPAGTQVKLLRLLREGRFEHADGGPAIEIRVRVAAATSQRLEAEVQRGRFLPELFERLAAIRIEVPPLRERPEDIPLLVEQFLETYARRGQAPKTLSAEALAALLGYRWPGNVRELENLVERAAVTTVGASIELASLPPRLARAAQLPPRMEVDLSRPLPEFLNELLAQAERAYLLRALESTHGHVSRCASLCGLSRRSISTKLRMYGIDKVMFKGTS
jgi:two-component system response regulator AtoC